VDTGPILERGWAERAGLGWVGKNANLISRAHGSWLLLGEILSSAELDVATEPHQEFCGNCMACIDACPTSAIIADGVVDSRLCISYWTIEHRGPIPTQRRPGLQDWIFGCDVCQEVCPWNQRFAEVVPEQRFAVRIDLAAPDAEEILAMDEATFRERYSGTSFMRAKWEGMRRNACVALGNLALPDSLPALSGALDDADPVVRAHAAWALGRVGGGEAARILTLALQRERSDEVAREIRAALSETGSAKAEE
jgi:epoxyqueuosine reductase